MRNLTNAVRGMKSAALRLTMATAMAGAAAAGFATLFARKLSAPVRKGFREYSQKKQHRAALIEAMGRANEECVQHGHVWRKKLLRVKRLKGAPKPPLQIGLKCDRCKVGMSLGHRSHQLKKRLNRLKRLHAMKEFVEKRTPGQKEVAA